MINNLPWETFDLPIQEIRRGYYSDVYFWRTKQILESQKKNPKILMQVFQRNDAVLCGIDEVRAVISTCAGYFANSGPAFYFFDELMEVKKEIRRAKIYDYQDSFLELCKKRIDLEEKLSGLWKNMSGEIIVKSLKDGDQIYPWETVMTIEGPFSYFAHLETVYLGILSRRTKVASNVKKVVEAANKKPVLFFPARFDHYSIQAGDGYAAFMSGVLGVSTDAQGEWWGKKGVGTIPHALIAAFNGDTVAATLAFAKQYPKIDVIALVDFDNDCVETSLEVAGAMKKQGRTLWGVRLDTSGTMVDKSVISQMGRFNPVGVCQQLVWNVRQALDKEGFSEVRVGVSGGFNIKRIKEFEAVEVPVDFYGVGSSLFEGNYDFTADIVKNEGKFCSKAGRQYNPNPNLKL
jgi:nicotinate phosphoribosyltransferase